MSFGAMVGAHLGVQAARFNRQPWNWRGKLQFRQETVLETISDRYYDDIILMFMQEGTQCRRRL
jgi:hypothetical protein